MKTNQYLFKLSVFAIVLFFTGIHVYSLDNIAISIKKNQTLLVKFFETDTVLIVVSETCVLSAIDKADIENAIFWENDQPRPVYVYMAESKITKQDLNKHMLFYGCLQQFQRKEFFSIPVKKGKKGFRFDNKDFDQPTDAFFYVNKGANRMYLCKNSENIRHQFFTLGGTAYPMHIFSGNKIVITGVI